MAGIGTVLGELFGGYGAGKRANADAATRHQEFEQQNDQAQQDLELRRTAAQEQHDLEAARLEMQRNAARIDLRARGYDPDTGQQLPMPALPKSLSQIVPGNGGNAVPAMANGAPAQQQPTADQQITHALGVAAWAAQHGRPDLAEKFTSIANAYGLNAQREGTVGLDAARVRGIDQGTIPLDKARANFYSTAHQYALQIAQGHDAAQLTRAKQEMMGRADIARINDGSREAVAEIAGALRLSGVEASAAAAQARTEYNNRFRDYLQRTNPQNALLDPSGANAAPPIYGAPTYNLNLGTPPAGGAGGGTPPPLPPGAVRGTVHTSQGDVPGYMLNGRYYTLLGQPVK